MPDSFPSAIGKWKTQCDMNVNILSYLVAVFDLNSNFSNFPILKQVMQSPLVFTADHSGFKFIAYVTILWHI